MKSKPASPKHLRRLAGQGIIRHARDLVNSVILAFSLLLLILFVPAMYQVLKESFEALWQFDTLSINHMHEQVSQILKNGIVLLFCYMLGVAVVAYLIHVLVSGFVFNPKRILPRLSNFSVIKYFRQVFSLNGFFNAIKLLFAYVFMLIVMVALVYLILKADVSADLDQTSGFLIMTEFSVLLIIALLAIALMIGTVDFIMEYIRFKHKSMMSVHEVKEEAKSENVSPELQRAIKMRSNTLRKRRKSI